MFNYLLDYTSQSLLNEWLQNSFLSNIHFFFIFLGFLDTTPYYLTICALFTAVFSRQTSVRYLYLLSFVLYATIFLKHFFDCPRPGAIMPHLDLSSLGPKWGFPSGAAMGSLVLGALLLRHIQSSLAWVLAFLYVFCITLSRVYLGAHFLVDILGGLFFGAMIWIAFIAIEKIFDRQRNPMSNLTFLIVSFLTIALMLTLDSSKSSVELVTMIVGFTLGQLPDIDYKKNQNKAKKIGFAILGLYLIFVLTMVSIPFIKFGGLMLIGIWLSSGSPFLFNLFSEIAENKNPLKK